MPRTAKSKSKERGSPAFEAEARRIARKNEAKVSCNVANNALRMILAEIRAPWEGSKNGQTAPLYKYVCDPKLRTFIIKTATEGLKKQD